MGQCISSQSPSSPGSHGTQGAHHNALPADLDLPTLASLLRSATTPEQRTNVLQRISKATAKAGDEECAAARFTLIEAEGVLEPLTGVRAWMTLRMHCVLRLSCLLMHTSHNIPLHVCMHVRAALLMTSTNESATARV